jgi:hypothetical protein
MIALMTAPVARTAPWDGRLATYAAIRDAVGTGPDGRPGFYAAGMLTANWPAPARLWDGRAWVQVPLGWHVAAQGERRWTAHLVPGPSGPVPVAGDFVLDLGEARSRADPEIRGKVARALAEMLAAPEGLAPDGR